jgi:hypothetical protein
LVDRFRALTHVLRHESSFSLGTAGRRLRAAVDALQRHDLLGRPAGTERTRLLRNAADALSAVVIQREALGIRDQTPLIETYGIRQEIWRSMGIIDRDSPPPANQSRVR